MEERAFKEKLVWLKGNELKLSPKHFLDFPSSSNAPVIVNLENVDGLGQDPWGKRVIHEVAMLERIRGLGSPSKRAQIKSLISSYDPDVSILTETKLHNLISFNSKTLWEKNCVN